MMNWQHHRSGGRETGSVRIGPARPVWLPTAALAAVMLALLGTVVAHAAGEIDRIREKAAEMVMAVNRAKAEPFTEGKSSALEKAYGGYAYLLTRAKRADLDKLVAEAPDDATRAQNERTRLIIDLYAIGAGVAPVRDNCCNSLREKTVAVEDASLRLLDLDYRLTLQGDRDKRLKWWMGAGQLYKTMTIYRRNLAVDLNNRSKELGYEGYYPFLQLVEGWDIETMRAAAERLLDDTSAAFAEQLEALCQAELGMQLRKMRTYDADFVFSFPTLSKQAGKIDPVDVTARTFKGAGLALEKQRTLKIDVREKAGRLPYATAWELQAGKAEVTMIPTGRLSDLPDLLGAIGEAQFYYNVPGDLAFESAYIGANVLPATYRALFAMIAEEPAWVAATVKPKDAKPEEVADAMKLRRLYLARRAAGEFLFQLQLHADPNVNPSAYNEMMERALLWSRIANDNDLYYMVNDDYRAGGRLLGYVMAAQIRDALVQQWGAEWFRNEKLGAKVIEGARKGYAISVPDFLALWGVTALDPGVMMGQLAQR